MDKIFKAMADINRRKILTLLKNGEMSVNELLKNFEITQATLSNHLSVLKKASLVENRIFGKQRIYRLNMEVLRVFAKNIDSFIGIFNETVINDIKVRTKN